MTPDSLQPLGAQLRAYRARQHMTQSQLAKCSRISANCISEIERGIVTRPREYTLQPLATALELSNEEFLAFQAAAQAAWTPRAARTVTDPPSRPYLAPLVGRENERRRIAAWLTNGNAPAFVLIGPPDVGKSRLLADTAEHARQKAMIVLRGACAEPGDLPRPYAPIAQALAGYLRVLNKRERRRLLKGCEAAQVILPIDLQIGPLSTWRVKPASERQRLFSAVAQVVARIAATADAGVLLALDNLQWALPDGLALLSAIARDAVNQPNHVRLLMALRDDPSADATSQSQPLLDLEHDQLLRWLPLEQLIAEDRSVAASALARRQTAAYDHAAALLTIERYAEDVLRYHAHETATIYFRDALTHAAALQDYGAIARLHTKLGRLAIGHGHYAQALEELADSLAFAARVGDNARQAEAIAQIGWAHALQGTAAEGLACLELWLTSAKLASLPPQGQSAIFCARAALLFILNRYGDQLESANRALDLADAALDIAAAASANRQKGLALDMLGRLAEAQLALAKTAALAEQVGDLQTYAAALNDLSDVYRMRGDLHVFQGYIARAVTAAERLGDLAITAFVAASHGDAAYLLGDWVTARLRYERATRIARNLGDSWATPYPLLALGRLNLAQGNTAEALGLLYEAQRLAQQSDDQQALRNIQPILAEHDLLRGVAKKALADLRQLLNAANSTGSSAEKDVIAALPCLAWAQLATGATVDAAATLDRCQRQAEAMGAQSIVLDALLVRALLRILRKRVDDLAAADNILRAALRMAREMANPYARAKALYLYGLLDITRGRRAAARKRLRAAHAFCVRLGERLYRQNIAHALRRLANGGRATPSVAVR